MNEYEAADLDHEVDPFSVYSDYIYDECLRCGLACTSDGMRHGTDDD